jgi:hypothetical protein
MADGPYGFSLELSRTGAVADPNETIGSAKGDKANVGRVVSSAAPTPMSCANLRRVIEAGSGMILDLRGVIECHSLSAMKLGKQSRFSEIPQDACDF